MRLHTNQILAAFALLLAVLAARATAQINLPFGPENYSHDFQLFAPVEIDLDNEPMIDDYGYLVNYSKLAWSFSGEHVTIGDPDVTVLRGTHLLRRIRDDIGTAAAALPDSERPAERASGCRLRLGRPLRNRLPRPRQRLDDRHPRRSRAIAVRGLRHVADVAGHARCRALRRSIQAIAGPDRSGGRLYALGFGNVHINFETPAGYLLGFRDYLNFLADAAIGTQVGPVAYVGNYGGLHEDDIDDDP